MGRLCFFSAIFFFTASNAWADNYGAIAYDSSDEAWGVSWDYNTQNNAEKEALNNCSQKGTRCEIVVHVINECGAYATGSGDASGWGSGNSRIIAERNALKYCREHGRDCALRAWVCSTDAAECAQKNIAKSGCEDRNSTRRIQGDSFQESCPPGCP